MKTKLIITIVLVLGSLFLFSFTDKSILQGKRTEEYGMIRVGAAGYLEKAVPGKVELIKYEVSKSEGGPGKTITPAILRELEKMNEEGFELVNAAFTPQETLFIFKRKL